MPPRIANEAELDDLLTQPTPEVVETFRRCPGDVIILGVAGKMGITFARMARRAADQAGGSRRVIGAARFSAGGEEEFQRHGVETIRCDLLDEDAVARLPDAPNVIFLAARKFGSTGEESLTWAMNAVVPSFVCKRYRTSRIVALSTGNVYPLVARDSGGACESEPPQPVGEYGMSCLAKERVFEHFSRTNGTLVSIIRLNYACDLRYGVLVDVAQKVWRGEPIDVTMGYFNTIWQGDACAMALRSLEHAASPPWVVNVTGPECLSVRDVAIRFAELMGKRVQVQGAESPTALLSNSGQACERFGSSRMSTDELIERVAHWVSQGGRSLNKPTHFEVRDGKF